MHLADLVQGASHTLPLQHCSMADVDTGLVKAVKGWGQGPSWQIKVLEVLGTKNDLVKLWFSDATAAEAIAEANTLLEQGERLPCHGGCR